MPGLLKGHACRITSPSGGSTLITSAPKSARICVAYGPITTVVRSRTRTPCSGPAIRASLFRLYSGFLGHLRPLGGLGLDELAELRGVHRRDVGAERIEARLHVGL